MWADDQLAGLEQQLREIRRERAFYAALGRVERRSRIGFIALGAVLVAIGTAVWVKSTPLVGMFIVVWGLGFGLSNYIPTGWMSPGILKRVRWLERRPTGPSQVDNALTQLVALAHPATTDADYGPNGKQVVRLFALLERLTSDQWERLEAVTMRSAEKWLAESRLRHDHELAAREASLERRIAQKRETPWDVDQESGEGESDWMWAHLTALRRLADLRVGQGPPSGLSLIPVRRAIKAVIRRGTIDETEFLADWKPFRDAIGLPADDVLRQ